MFKLIRIVMLAGVLVVCAVAVEPRWDGSQRTLRLRLRSPGEMVSFVRTQTERFARAEDDAPGRAVTTSDVAAGPVSRDETPQEAIMKMERESLDRLVREKTRED